ncbi:MAG: hypothetical protein ACW981_16365 [Candidatus Hodarchaeales archaeon]|jgi:hypothetical protein
MFMNHWALFIEIDQIKWSFGIEENQEFQNTTARFIQSLQAIGRELYEQGVASIKLDTTQTDIFATKEIFIVNLSDQFFFIISDLQVTSKLIFESTTIPFEVEQIINAVLVGQAAIIYSFLKENEYDGNYLTDEIFRSILTSMKLSYELDFLVADGRCSLSPLNFQELLLFHYLLRNYFESSLSTSSLRKKDSWAIMVNKDGTDIPLSYMPPKDPLLLGNFLGAVYSYVQALFGVKPQALVFGGSDLTYLQYFGGSQYFLCASNPEAIFNDETFLEILRSIQSQKRLDIAPAINEYLIITLSKHYEEELRNKLEKHKDITRALEIFRTTEGKEESAKKSTKLGKKTIKRKVKNQQKSRKKKR